MTTLHVSHKENEKCGLEKYIKVLSKWKLKNKMKNWLMKCSEVFLMYIFKILKNFKWHDCYKFYIWESISHFKILIFCINFLINHMFRDIHRLVY